MKQEKTLKKINEIEIDLEDKTIKGEHREDLHKDKNLEIDKLRCIEIIIKERNIKRSVRK